MELFVERGRVAAAVNTLMKGLLCVAAAFAAAGCQSVRPISHCCPILVQEMEKRGITSGSTRKIVVVGTEADDGRAVHVAVTEGFIIQDIWDTIYDSYPYGAGAASGLRTLRFYSDPASSVPQAELAVSETDGCHLAGAFADAFRCPELNGILDPLLKREYERQEGRSPSPAHRVAPGR